MSLFENRRRSIALAALVAGAAYGVTFVIPSSIHAYNLMQSAIALLAIASLAVLVVMHHRRNVGYLTNIQEEMILMGAFGLFWLAVLIALRASGQRTTPGQASEVSLQSASRGGRAQSAREPGFRQRPSQCSSDAVYCVVEEWTYW